ncbi:NADH dehydrogenase subunit 3 (mitochondrion) [Priapulus caudatus]|uniref:NADH-ubiquinone oxidoreductase chain 3 n=1 Tax=Priapulus caudatus TaxID=37621 RepID=A0MCV1_PRICU|nr:NADH dehydrogenase subunit 3 [Priapulus caudatus]ABE03646.1 NADH dehydrogenase subunit 3 [Priapulus caudatus]
MMTIILIYLLFVLFVAIAVAGTAILVSFKSNKDFDKLSPFECGFDPLKSARTPFSLRFFLVAMVFLIFDVEITLILPTPLALKTSEQTMVMMMGITFMIILLVGLFHEWSQGALEWAEWFSI